MPTGEGDVEPALGTGNAAGAPGPTAVVRPAGVEWPRVAKVSGSTVALFLDSSVPGADMYGGINVVAAGATIPVHWHSSGEFQFILSGTGVFVDATGVRSPVSPYSTVFSPAGANGAHGFVNTGLFPLTILFVYPALNGTEPDFNLVNHPIT